MTICNAKENIYRIGKDDERKRAKTFKVQGKDARARRNLTGQTVQQGSGQRRTLWEGRLPPLQYKCEKAKLQTVIHPV